MRFKCKVESIKSLKPTVTEEGEVQVIKGSFIFDVNLADAGVLNGQDVYVIPVGEFKYAPDNTIGELCEKMDKSMAIQLAMSAIIKEMSKPNVGLSSSESV